nr:AMP-binding protein [Massilia sp. IC2-278]
MLHRLAQHAARTPERVAYTFLHENGEAADVSYRQLAARVAALAALLARRVAPGARALLLYPPGCGFVVAFFACLAAGVVAVPAAPAHRRRDAERLAALLADAAPAIVLGAPDTEEATRVALARAGCTAPLLCVDVGDAGISVVDAAADAAQPALPDAGALAFLQYTSGSTAQPKGVEITHANLAANVAAIGQAFGFGPRTVMVSWLPPFHDMGLVGSIAAPLALGFRSVLMSPGAFLRRPALWLETVTRYRATCSGAPNFAWDLCVRRIAPEAAARLDLSCLEVLYNGAEPVRAATLERFMAAFGPCGLRRGALFPCYGMAEATLLVAGGPLGRGPRILALDAAALERGQVRAAAPGDAMGRAVVSCGPLAPGVTVAIADPDSGAAVGAGLVGEIRIGGPGVSRGYHGHVTVAAAQAAPGAVLPSGDLGFLHEGELFVTGRRKDLIIVNGRNLYAQDIEELVERAAGMAAPNCCAAFGIDDGTGERLAVVVEASRALARSGDVEALGRRIRSAVTAGLGIGLHTLAFVAPGAFPRTTSGKVQRARCKALLAAGALAPVQPRAQAIPQDGDIRETGSAARADTIIAWLRRYAARRINSALDDERRAMAPHLLLDLGNHGLFGLQAPLDAGGQALASTDLVRVMAQLAAIDLTLATVVGVHNGLGLRPLLRSAGAPLRSRWLPALAAGRQLAAFAMSEPQAGSNPRAIGARALRVDGGWRLSGDKHLIGLAAWSGVLSVFARAFDPAGRALGTVALLVPEDAPGLVQGPEALTMGMRAMVQNALRFDDVFVPDEQVLGVPGAGMEVAQDAMAFARLGIGALCVGAMQRCVQLMARYAARRDVAGGRLLDNPVTALRLHELDCAIGAAGALVQALAHAVDAADGADGGATAGNAALQDACSACKCVLSELLWSAADSLMQLLGGRGYLENNIAARLLRDARVLRILEGPSEALYAHLGALVRTPGNPLARIIAGLFGAPALADSLARLPAAGQGQWQDWRNGEFAAWTLLAAAARGEAAAWAARRLDALRDAIAAERPAAGACPSAAALLARVQAYALAIGDVEQTLPGAAYALDPLLGREAPEAGRATAVAATAAVPAAAAAVAVAVAVDPAGQGAALASLRASASASAPFIQPAPASASSVELVRACLLKWLRESAAEPFDGSGVHLSTGTLRRQPHIEVGIDASFGDLGIDSLASVPLALEIEAASGVRVGAELLYDYPTVRALAAYIDAQRDERRDA